MKPKNIMDALNNIDEELIEAAEESKKTAGCGWKKWVAAAACLVLLIGVGAAFLGKKAPQWIGEGGRDGAGSDSQVKTTVLNLDALPEGTLEPLTRKSFDRLVKFAQQIYEEYEEICWMSPKGGDMYCQQEEEKLLQIKPDHQTSAAIWQGEPVTEMQFGTYEYQIGVLLNVLMRKSIPEKNYTDDWQIEGMMLKGRNAANRYCWYFPDMSKSQYDSAKDMIEHCVYLREKYPELYSKDDFQRQLRGDCKDCESFINCCGWMFYCAPGVGDYLRDFEIVYPTKELRAARETLEPYWLEQEEVAEKSYQEAVKAYFAENGQ